MADHDRALREAYDDVYRHKESLLKQVAEQDLELAARDARIERLLLENNGLRATLNGLSEVKERQEDVIHDLKRKSSKLRNERDSLKVENRELRHEHDAKHRTMVDQINALKQEAANWRLQCESEKRQKDDLHRRLGLMRKSTDKYAADNTVLISQNESLRAQNQNLMAENERLAEVLDLERRLRISRR